MQNPYYLYENLRMTHMPWSTPTVNNSFAYTENASKSYSKPKISVKAKAKDHPQK